MRPSRPARHVVRAAAVIAAASLLVCVTGTAGAATSPAPGSVQHTLGRRPPSSSAVRLQTARRAIPNTSRTLTVRTVPPVPNVTFRFLDRTFVTETDGVATLSITVDERNRLAQDRGAVLSVVTPTVQLDGTHRANFAGWSGKGTYRWSPTDPIGAIETATFRTDRLVSFRFTDQHGTPVSTSRVQRFEIRSNTGAVERFAPGTARWLHSTDVVIGPDGPVQRKLSYSVVDAQVQRSNLVNAGQQRFTPAEDPGVSVALLFFGVTFHASDAIFGSSVKGRMVLTYPDDTTKTVELRRGRATLTGLPRGLYQIGIEGPGPTSNRPVTISSGKIVQVNVVTWRDLGAGLGILVAAAVLVLVMALLLRRRHARLTSSSAPDPISQSTREREPVDALP